MHLDALGAGQGAIIEPYNQHSPVFRIGQERRCTGITMTTLSVDELFARIIFCTEEDLRELLLTCLDAQTDRARLFWYLVTETDLPAPGDDPDPQDRARTKRLRALAGEGLRMRGSGIPTDRIAEQMSIRLATNVSPEQAHRMILSAAQGEDDPPDPLAEAAGAAADRFAEEEASLPDIALELRADPAEAYQIELERRRKGRDNGKT